MTNPAAPFEILGYPIRVHWSAVWAVPLVAGHAAFTQGIQLALIYSLVTVLVLCCVLLQGFARVFLASRVGLGTRDLIVYPFWTCVRFTTISDRPRQEICISVTSPLTHALIAAFIALFLSWVGQSAKFPEPAELDFGWSILALLCWCNLLLALLHLLPFLPLDMGQMFRAALAMTSGRSLATEIASYLSIFGSLLLVVAGLSWLDSPLIVCLSISLYLSCQEDLGRTRYFAAIQTDRTQLAEPLPAIMIPIDQILDASCRPPEERFSGFTWNRKTRLWIQWLEGRAVGANALVGD